MLTSLPAYIIILFVLTVVFTFLFFISALKNKKTVSVIVIAWLALQGILAYSGFYLNTAGFPPRFALAVAPAIIFIILLWVTKKGRAFMDTLDLKKLTLLHVIRIPVEITLYALAAKKAVPELMTFAGRNFDIVAGFTAPVLWYLCFSNGLIKHKKLLLLWNFISLGLLLNIVINAVLSAPFTFQQFGFDQPNIAILYFPFVWLPSFIVMTVLLSHLAAIRQLLKK